MHRLIGAEIVSVFLGRSGLRRTLVRGLSAGPATPRAPNASPQTQAHKRKPWTWTWPSRRESAEDPSPGPDLGRDRKSVVIPAICFRQRDVPILDVALKPVPAPAHRAGCLAVAQSPPSGPGGGAGWGGGESA